MSERNRITIQIDKNNDMPSWRSASSRWTASTTFPRRPGPLAPFADISSEAGHDLARMSVWSRPVGRATWRDPCPSISALSMPRTFTRTATVRSAIFCRRRAFPLDEWS